MTESHEDVREDFMGKLFSYGLVAALGNLGKNGCGGCHKNFRAAKKKKK